MKVHQLMTREVISVQAQTPLADIIQLFTQYRVNNLPVIDAQQRVIGLVNQLYMQTYADLMAAAHTTCTHVTAADVMSSDVICVSENDRVSEVAWLVVQHGADLLPVLRDGQLVGVVSRTDLIRLFALAG
ncbi:MAG TPA: CBS domain-containing protein [Phototrophicaceae bacterium]|nr:CBS domain-containing protein [Phototrophicaceae bacterium]